MEGVKMERYEQEAWQEVIAWKKKMFHKPSTFERISKKTQGKINQYIPGKVHRAITESIKGLVEGVLSGSSYISKEKQVDLLSLQQKEEWVKETISTYRKTAVVEGAGTGAGGLFLGLADFPLLLSIKMKLLFEIARLYGFDAKQYEERLFILYVFQLAFCSDEKRAETLQIIERWGEATDIDWQVLQQEYRDHIDLVKMFQLIPGIGAVVGAYANRQLIDQLGETAMNCYRIRLIAQER